MDGWMDGQLSVDDCVSILESVDWMVVFFMSICLKCSPLLFWMADVTASVESEVFSFRGDGCHFGCMCRSGCSFRQRWSIFNTPEVVLCHAPCQWWNYFRDVDIVVLRNILENKGNCWTAPTSLRFAWLSLLAANWKSPEPHVLQGAFNWSWNWI